VVTRTPCRALPPERRFGPTAKTKAGRRLERPAFRHGRALPDPSNSQIAQHIAGSAPGGRAFRSGATGVEASRGPTPSPLAAAPVRPDEPFRPAASAGSSRIAAAPPRKR
jgi:hypothetical protein